jgi:hypothetical protein
MLIDHDDPTPYHGVAEMIARSKATMLSSWEVKQVIDEHPGERACRADGPRTHDPEAIAKMEAYFDGLGPEWQEFFAEIDRRDPNMREAADRRSATLTPASSAFWDHVHAMGKELYGPAALPSLDDDEPSAGDVADAVERAR